MATRMNFDARQRESAFRENANWLRSRRVDGIELALAYEPLRLEGRVYWCENCGFCHTDQEWFDIDHFVPDREMREGPRHTDAALPENMAVLCKSRNEGDLGCNQSKGARLFVPRDRGLAITHPELDMNCIPVRERPFSLTVPRIV